MNMFRTSDRIELADGYHLTVIDEPDAPSLVKHLNEPEFSHHTLSIPTPYTAESASWFINHVMTWEKENGRQKDWAIRSATGEMIGAIGVLYDYGISAHKSGMGYWLAKPYWNQGLMTICINKFSAHIFATTSLVRLEAHVFKYNPASARCLAKAGFEYEGMLRSSHRKGAEFLDTELWSILKISSKY